MKETDRERGSHVLLALYQMQSRCVGNPKDSSHLHCTWQMHSKSRLSLHCFPKLAPCCFNPLLPCPTPPRWHPLGFQRKGWRQRWRPGCQCPHEASQPGESKVWIRASGQSVVSFLQHLYTLLFTLSLWEAPLFSWPHFHLKIFLDPSFHVESQSHFSKCLLSSSLWYELPLTYLPEWRN